MMRFCVVVAANGLGSKHFLKHYTLTVNVFRQVIECQETERNQHFIY